MEKRNFFITTSKKSIREFIESIRENAGKYNFGVRQVFDMREEYRNHGIDTDDNFKLYQIIVCNFKRSYKSMRKNIERAAVLLQPKQIIVFSKGSQTTINYLPFTGEFIKKALPEDKEFAESLSESCQKIIKLIEASK